MKKKSYFVSYTGYLGTVLNFFGGFLDMFSDDPNDPDFLEADDPNFYNSLKALLIDDDDSLSQLSLLSLIPVDKFDERFKGKTAVLTYFTKRSGRFYNENITVHEGFIEQLNLSINSDSDILVNITVLN